MTWNHRVVKVTEGDELFYGIHEAYYHKGEGEPYAWTDEPVAPIGETLDELRIELERMLAALDKPVIEQ